MFSFILAIALTSFLSSTYEPIAHIESGRCEQAVNQFLRKESLFRFQRFESYGGVTTYVFKSMRGEVRVSAGLLAKVVVCPETAQRKKGKTLREWKCSSDSLRITFASNLPRSCSAVETSLQNFASILVDCYKKRADRVSLEKAKLQQEVLNKRINKIDCRSKTRK